MVRPSSRLAQYQRRPRAPTERALQPETVEGIIPIAVVAEDPAPALCPSERCDAARPVPPIVLCVACVNDNRRNGSCIMFFQLMSRPPSPSLGSTFLIDRLMTRCLLLKTSLLRPTPLLDTTDWDDDLGTGRNRDGGIDDAVLLGADQLFQHRRLQPARLA